MEETYNNIIENIEFSKKDLFLALLKKTVHVSNDSTKSTYAIHDNIVFKTQDFFKGFSPFVNEFGKNKKYEAGVHALMVILEELGVEIEKEECFILYHIRDLGKFRMREDKLLQELKGVWGEYKEYKIDDSDFVHHLKNLMRMKFINYRRGNLHFNPNIIIRYRTGK